VLAPFLAGPVLDAKNHFFERIGLQPAIISYMTDDVKEKEQPSNQPKHTENDPARFMGAHSVMKARRSMKLGSIQFILISWSLWPLVALAQSDGLVAYYPFDGNAVEATGSGLNGAVFNATFSAGIAGSCLQIASLGDHAEIPSSDAINLNVNNKTISVWFLAEAPLTRRASIFDRTAISDYALWLVTTNASSFLRFDVYDGGYKQIGTPVTLWGWHHAAIQKDAGSIVLFLDAQRAGATNATSVRTKNKPLIVGAGGTPFIRRSTNYNFHGLIDELRFYDRTLSEAEIRVLYAQGTHSPNNPLTVAAGGTPRIQGSTNSNSRGLIDERGLYNRTRSEAEMRALQAQGTLSLRMEVSPLRVCWRSQTGLTYQVQYRGNLTTGAWTNLGTPIPGDGSWQCVTVDGALPSRFYRMMISP